MSLVLVGLAGPAVVQAAMAMAMAVVTVTVAVVMHHPGRIAFQRKCLYCFPASGNFFA